LHYYTWALSLDFHCTLSCRVLIGLSQVHAVRRDYDSETVGQYDLHRPRDKVSFVTSGHVYMKLQDFPGAFIPNYAAPHDSGDVAVEKSAQ